MRIWVTRSAPEAEATADRLRARGHAPLVAPVLNLRRTEGPPPSLAGVGAVAFTSRNAVTVFCELSPERALPVFAVGDATARAAREAGFERVTSADGDVEALAALIAARCGELSGPVLHAGASEPAGDLLGALTAAGVPCLQHASYRVEDAEIPLAATAALQARPVELDAILVHSPRAARRLAAFEPLETIANDLQAFCISPAAAAPLRSLNFGRVTWAPLPNETSLLDLIDR